MFGFSPAKVQSSQTAENVTEVIPVGAKKTQLLELGSRMAAKAAEFVESPDSTKPLEHVNPRDL